MPNLSAAAEKSLKTRGAYKCKAPNVPYRAMSIDPLATAFQNKLYLMAMIRALNEGDCYRDAVGKITTRLCSWVWVHAVDDLGPEVLGEVYMSGIEGAVAYVVKGGPCVPGAVDFSSDSSDHLGFYHMPVDRQNGAL